MKDNKSVLAVLVFRFERVAKPRKENIVTARQTDGDSPVMYAYAQRHTMILKD